MRFILACLLWGLVGCTSAPSIELTASSLVLEENRVVSLDVSPSDSSIDGGLLFVEGQLVGYFYPAPGGHLTAQLYWNSLTMFLNFEKQKRLRVTAVFDQIQESMDLVAWCGPGRVACSGQCADLMTDARHCGACSHPLSTRQYCIGGKGYCESPSDLVCPGLPCVNSKEDPRNCGACGNVCSGVCIGGVCS